ncbi:hypothetical protein GCM10025869_17310 [Homoserinibacter gongjuensis]|uniref:Uncharacterized protein n=1 Tax=Homoserinibacter gongjuensis TaxID=1162968 RepID=A0ABQ6JWU6_9MICO|nr:hypothetical protein GCM10025869_17310 [Homoserinibacter gongjuensis]
MHSILDERDLTDACGGLRSGVAENGERYAHATPFLEMDRAAWAALAPTAAHPLSEQELVRLRGLGDTLDLREVADVYVPLSRLLNLYAVGARELHRSTRGSSGRTTSPRRS